MLEKRCVLDIQFGENMERAVEHESLEDRCLAIEEDTSANSQESSVADENGVSVTSIVFSENQHSLERMIAVSRQGRSMDNCAPSSHATEWSDHQHEGRENAMDSTQINLHVNGPSKRCVRRKPCTPDENDSSLHDSESKLLEAEKTIQDLRYEVVKLRQANKMWAAYAAEVKSQQKLVSKSLRCCSAEDIRNSGFAKVSPCNTDTKCILETRKSDGDTNMNAYEDDRIKGLTTRVTLLTQQVKIFRDDFALERRDRIKAATRAEKYKNEVERLKEQLATKNRHDIKGQCRQVVQCDDFDYLNQ